MPVYPVEFQPPALLGAYPNMSRRDAPLWEAYLKLYAVQWQGFAYNVALGGLEVEDPEATPEMREMWRYNTAEKIDVVANRGDAHWLIEVKPNARLGALGQVLGYLILASREPWTQLPLVPAVLTDNVSTDVRYVAGQLGVELLVVPLEPYRGL